MGVGHVALVAVGAYVAVIGLFLLAREALGADDILLEGVIGGGLLVAGGAAVLAIGLG